MPDKQNNTLQIGDVHITGLTDGSVKFNPRELFPDQPIDVWEPFYGRFPEYFIARFEPRDVLTDGNNCASKIHSKYLIFWTKDSEHRTGNFRISCQREPVSLINRRRMDVHEDFFRADLWFLNFFNLDFMMIPETFEIICNV